MLIAKQHTMIHGQLRPTRVYCMTSPANVGLCKCMLRCAHTEPAPPVLLIEHPHWLVMCDYFQKTEPKSDQVSGSNYKFTKNTDDKRVGKIRAKRCSPTSQIQKL